MNLTMTFLFFKMLCCCHADLIRAVLAVFKTWELQNSSATSCQASRATSNNRSSASQKRYFSRFPGIHAP